MKKWLKKIKMKLGCEDSADFLIFSLFLMSLIFVLIVAIVPPNNSEASSSNGFESIYSDGAYQIVVDQNTGVAYLVYSILNRGGGITPLLDENGKPIIIPLSD